MRTQQPQVHIKWRGTDEKKKAYTVGMWNKQKQRGCSSLIIYWQNVHSVDSFIESFRYYLIFSTQTHFQFFFSFFLLYFFFFFFYTFLVKHIWHTFIRCLHDFINGELLDRLIQKKSSLRVKMSENVPPISFHVTRSKKWRKNFDLKIRSI